MSKQRTIVLNSIVAVVALSYLVAAGILLSERQPTTKCKSVKINIGSLSGSSFVTDSTIMKWIDDDTITMIGTPVSKLDLGRIRAALLRQPHVSDAQVFADIKGTLTIAVTQRRPLLRIKTDNGYDFYIDSTLSIMPPQGHCHPTLPIVSGDIKFAFGQKYFGKLDPINHLKDREYLNNIRNFVEYIETSDFLRKFIAQIYITRRGDIELVPRIGTQIIDMGTIEEYETKLTKLEKFYLASFSQRWWETATRVTLKYRGQVIVSNPINRDTTVESDKK